MIQAERLVLEAALEDPANQIFVFLSDSFLDKKEGRCNPKMSLVIPRSKWRKGSQWIFLVRSHAEVVIDDEVIFPIFKKFCKRCPPIDASKGKNIMSDLKGELERRTVTYTLWNHSTTNMERRGWHPIMFSHANAGPQQIKRIKDVNHVYHETEYWTEWCSNNSTLVPGFLFARKFSQGAAMRLLSEGVVGPFDASTLLVHHHDFLNPLTYPALTTYLTINLRYSKRETIIWTAE